jgi:hypothetical protein
LSLSLIDRTLMQPIESDSLPRRLNSITWLPLRPLNRISEPVTSNPLLANFLIAFATVIFNRLRLVVCVSDLLYVCILSGRELKVNRFSGKDQEVFSGGWLTIHREALWLRSGAFLPHSKLSKFSLRSRLLLPLGFLVFSSARRHFPTSFEVFSQNPAKRDFP